MYRELGRAGPESGVENASTYRLHNHLRHNFADDIAADRLEPAAEALKAAGAAEVMTNTLHGQGIKTPGPRIVIDGHAPDGTPEATYLDGAPGFTLSVQWHPEWNAANDPVSRPLFEAFGRAARDWSEGRRPRALRSA